MGMMLRAGEHPQKTVGAKPSLGGVDYFEDPTQPAVTAQRLYNLPFNFNIPYSPSLTRIVRIMTMEPKLHLRNKSETLVRRVVSDARWQLEDEQMCQVLGFTLHGYLFGIGRLHCLMNIEDIHAVAIEELAGLGIGRKYVEGMIEVAHQEFMKQNNQSWQNQLNGVGHSHALQEDLNMLVESIFTNTALIKKARAAQVKKPFWKFWK